MKTGIELIAEERQRQIDVEDYCAERDDRYVNMELARAAVAYMNPIMFRKYWPCEWSRESFKASLDQIRNLVKAGALIAAEIDRLQRKANQ